MARVRINQLVTLHQSIPARLLNSSRIQMKNVKINGRWAWDQQLTPAKKPLSTVREMRSTNDDEKQIQIRQHHPNKKMQKYVSIQVQVGVHRYRHTA